MNAPAPPTTAARHEAPKRRSASDLLRRWVPVVTPALVLAVAAWNRRWTTDDAFINYRIVAQLAAGNGPVFNAGERVEAYTSPLWIAFLSIGRFVVPLDLEYTAIALSIPLAVVGLVAMSLASRRLFDPADEHRWWLPAGTLVLVAIPVVWDFTTGGLETALALAWIGLLTLGLARAVDSPGAAPTWVPVVAGLGPLVRPDAALLGGAVLLYVLADAWRTWGPRSTVRPLVAAAALPLAYQLFRMAYFAAVIPNTALAKQASTPHWTEGWGYLVDLVATYGLYLPVAALVVAALLVLRRAPARRAVAVTALPAASLLHVAYLVRAGGDYAHGRLLLPPLFALLAPVAMVPLRRNLAVVPVVALAVWAVVCAGFLRHGEARLVGSSIIADGRSSVTGSLGVAHPVTVADQNWDRDGARASRLREGPVTIGEAPVDVTLPSGLEAPVTALYGLGVTGYAAGIDVHVIDRLGLADPLTARFEVRESGFIGHEKPIPSPWLAARLTRGDELSDPAAFGSTGFTRPLHESGDGELAADTAAARQALDCPDLRRLRQATTGELTPARALANVWRAPGLTALRIDPDPQRAVADLC